MTDPTLKRTSVKITYTASDRYRSEVTYSNIGTGRARPIPHAPLLEAIEELGRLAELFGFGAQASEAFDGARLRVKNWRRERDAAAAKEVPHG